MCIRDRSLGDHPPRGNVHPLVRCTNSHLTERCSLRSEDDLIDGSLWRCELPVDREGTRNVCTQIPVFGCSVDQEEFSVLHQPVVVGVVQNAGIRPGRNNRRVRVARRTPCTELVLHRSLDSISVSYTHLTLPTIL